MAKPSVNSYVPSKEFYFDEGCFINELSNSANDHEVSIARARVKPGVTTRWHRLHGVTERYVILQGHGLLELEGMEAKQVKYGDTAVIPAQCHQRITNTGIEDLVFLAICSPRFSAQCYQESEPG